MGVVKMGKFSTQQQKLKHIFQRLQAIIKRHLPREMAIEAPFFGKNVQSMLKLGRAQGVAIAAAMTMDVEVQEYSPKKLEASTHADVWVVAVVYLNHLRRDENAAHVATLLIDVYQDDEREAFLQSISWRKEH